MSVKYNPNKIVISSEVLDSLSIPSIKAWWDQVILTPEDNKMIVFINGTPKGLNAWIPIGGQVAPSSTLGDKLLWKKAQKNEKKNITSEQINKSIPHRKPVSTMYVCKPW